MLAPLLMALSPKVDPAALDEAFSKAVAARKAPAVVAAMVEDGRVVWVKASGTSDLAGKKPATPDTVFRIASLTKAFTATLVLQLVNEKKVALDDSIGKILPTLPKAWHGATVRQLLTHTSGVPDNTSLPTFAAQMTKPITPQGLVDLTADKPLDFSPGSKFEYDNSGYVILGMIVERFDRQPFGASLQKRILKPLGMSRTTFDTGNAKDVAEGAGPLGGPAPKIHMSQPFAAGSIVSTANDMAKWVAAQGSEQLLPKALWEDAWTPGKLSNGAPIGYGFGWVLSNMNDVPTVGHGGAIPGFNTMILRVPSKKLGVVVLCSSNGSDATGVGTALLTTADPSLKAPTVAVADPDPKITETTERLLRGFEQGEPDKALLEPKFAEFLTPERLKGGQAFLRSNGAFKSLTLVKVDGTRRVYLAEYEKGKVRVGIDHNAEGLFTSFGIAPV